MNTKWYGLIAWALGSISGILAAQEVYPLWLRLAIAGLCAVFVRLLAKEEDGERADAGDVEALKALMEDVRNLLRQVSNDRRGLTRPPLRSSEARRFLDRRGDFL